MTSLHRLLRLGAQASTTPILPAATNPPNIPKEQGRRTRSPVCPTTSKPPLAARAGHILPHPRRGPRPPRSCLQRHAGVTRREQSPMQCLEITAAGCSRILKNVLFSPYRFSKRIDRMSAMGNRSQMRKFKRRRRGAGLVLLTSLAIVVLGVVLFFRTDPFQRTSAALMVERVAVPIISDAPQAVAERDAEETATTEAARPEAKE